MDNSPRHVWNGLANDCASDDSIKAQWNSEDDLQATQRHEAPVVTGTDGEAFVKNFPQAFLL